MAAERRPNSLRRVKLRAGFCGLRKRSNTITPPTGPILRDYTMKNMFYMKPLVTVAALAFSVGAFAAPWTVVPETSSVGFVGTQQGTKFNGRFQKFTATINLDAADPTKGTIAGTVQL